jgi:hypothetical protein
LQVVDKMVNYLQRSDSSICMEYTYEKGYTSQYQYKTIDIASTPGAPNQRPTMDDSFVVMPDDSSLITFDDNSIYNNYQDPENDPPGSFSIITLPANGGLFYEGELVKLKRVYHDTSLLTYVRVFDTAYNDFITYIAFEDGNQINKNSNEVTMTISVTALTTANNPPSIGDLALYSENRETFTISVQDILVGADPDYFDSEGDSLDAIRIDKISTSNKGIYYYYGSPIVLNQIISYNDIVLGAFTYSAANINTIQTDVIEVSIRDNVNLQWVSS